MGREEENEIDEKQEEKKVAGDQVADKETKEVKRNKVVEETARPAATREDHVAEKAKKEEAKEQERQKTEEGDKPKKQKDNNEVEAEPENKKAMETAKPLAAKGDRVAE